MPKSHWSLCVLFSGTDAGLCIYHLFVWSNLNLLYISLWITLPTQSCLVLYSFCTNLLHSLIMWLMVSSLSPHSLHFLFCCVFSILALIWLVLMAFCAAIKRDSVSLLLTESFSYQHKLIVFSWSLSNNRSPQVSRTHHSIPTDHNNTIVWVVFTPLIFKSFSPFTKLLVTVSRAPITISINITFMFHSFFNS